MIYAAWKIKREDGGKIFFSSKRIGKNLTQFSMHKFRTMVPNAEEILKEMLKDEKLRKEYEDSFKFKNDPRITPIGSFLRRTSLDELPQFFDVIMGKMSLVGPRPLLLSEIELSDVEDTAKQIFYVKPGITGLWQVNGRNDLKDYDERMKMNLYYIHNWSVWLDITILLKTPLAVFSHKGAY